MVFEFYDQTVSHSRQCLIGDIKWRVSSMMIYRLEPFTFDHCS